MEPCECEAAILAHIPIKDICLLIRKYLADISGRQIELWLDNHGTIEIEAFDMAGVEYLSETNELKYFDPSCEDTLTFCVPSRVASFLEEMVKFPEGSLLNWNDRATVKKMITFANEIGLRMELELHPHCHH